MFAQGDIELVQRASPNYAQTNPSEIIRTIISSNMSSRSLVLICNASGALSQHILDEVEDDFLLAWFKFILIR